MPPLKDGRKADFLPLRSGWNRAHIRPMTGLPTSPRMEGTCSNSCEYSDNVNVRPVKGENDVYACNFSRDAFRNQRWDEYSSKARGLFRPGTAMSWHAASRSSSTSGRTRLTRENIAASVSVSSARGTQGERIPRLGVRTRRRFVAFLVEERTDRLLVSHPTALQGDVGHRSGTGVVEHRP